VSKDKLDLLFNRYEELLFELVKLQKAKGLGSKEEEEIAFSATNKRLDDLDVSIGKMETDAPDISTRLRKSLNDLSDYYRWEHTLLEQQRAIDSTIHRGNLREERNNFRRHELGECIKDFNFRLIQVENNFTDLRKSIDIRIKEIVDDVVEAALENALGEYN